MTTLTMTSAGTSAASTPRRQTVGSALVVAVGLVLASAYGLLAEMPYRDLPDATVVGARAQDVCSLAVALLLPAVAWRGTTRADLVRLGLLAYVAYSYSIYLIGVPMNRVFLVYVVLVAVSGAAFLGGLVRLREQSWPREQTRALELGTGWMLVVVSAMFAALWLAVLVPFAAGGAPPATEGPGGVAYPVFILDLVVVLPCIAAVGVLLLRGREIGGPLAVVALIKIVTLFTALWAGVLVNLVRDGGVDLSADAGPSAALLVASTWLVSRWLRDPDPATQQPRRADPVD